MGNYSYVTVAAWHCLCQTLRTVQHRGCFMCGYEKQVRSWGNRRVGCSLGQKLLQMFL